MKRLIEFELEDGGTVLVEADEPAKGPVMRGAVSREIAEKAEQTFETALSNIKPVASAVLVKLRDLADVPEEVGIEFGIKLGAKTGAIIASADAEANFKVTMTWKR